MRFGNTFFCSYNILSFSSLSGKPIDNIVNKRQEPGSSAVDFDSRFHGGSTGLSSGKYFCLLKPIVIRKV
ncbi:MAG: hypothetical protein M3R36_14170 [Bacteroidota bacterium]|nr:hypothetical protein [Bacteroidota bacterium]